MRLPMTNKDPGGSTVWGTAVRVWEFLTSDRRGRRRRVLYGRNITVRKENRR